MIHVVTAFSRPAYAVELANNLRGTGVQWHVISSPGNICPVVEPWIHSRITPPMTHSPASNILYSKLNFWLDHCHVDDLDVIGFVNDDDAVLDGFFNILRTAIEPRPEVAFCSMLWEPGVELLAKPENLKVGRVGLEQFWVRADVMKKHRFRTDIDTADGEMAIALAAQHQHVFVPDAVVRFNALREGWWPK